MRETRIAQQRLTSIFSRIGEGEMFRTTLRPLLMLAGAGLLWLVSIPTVDPAGMSDLGLVSVLPFTFFVALAIIAVSFVITLHQDTSREYILLLHVVALIIILHSTPHLVYGTLRYSWAWKHLGIVDYIQRHGSVDPSITDLNAYHNWPGFFALMAFFNQVAGLKSSLTYAGWAPTFFNLLNLGALLVIFRTLTDDRRLVWLSAWFYFLFSWIGQDYFSPQAFAYFLYLITLAVVLKFFRINKVDNKIYSKKVLNPRLSKLYHSLVDRSIMSNYRSINLSPIHKVLLMLVLVLITFAIISSHQLTPVMLLSALILLVLFQVTDQRYVPVLIMVATATWVIFMAVGFLDGNIDWIIRSIGSLLDNVNETLIDLDYSSPGQQVVAKIDRALSISVWGLGLLGLIRRIRTGHWDLAVLGLSFAPLPILAFNAYGGEMLFRVYLFSLPFITFLAAALFYPNWKAGVSMRTPIFAGLVSFLLIPGFLFSYYGKERMYYFSPNEVAAAQLVYQVAPKGALIMDSTWNWPRQAVNYEFYNYKSLVRLSKEDRSLLMDDPVGMLTELMSEVEPGAVYIYGDEAGNQTEVQTAPNTPKGTASYPAAYLVITRSQMAEAAMTGVLPAGWFITLDTALSNSESFREIYRNPDAVIFEFINPDKAVDD